MGKPGGFSGSILLDEGVRIPLGDTLVSVPCCAKCKEVSLLVEPGAGWAWLWAPLITAASWHFSTKLSHNSLGGPSILLFLLFLGVGLGGAYALKEYLAGPKPPPVYRESGTTLLLSQISREIFAARHEVEKREAKAALIAKKKEAEAVAKAKEREAEAVAKAKEREAEAAAKAKKEQESFLRVIALYKKAAASTSAWRLDNPEEARRLDEAVESKVQSAVDAEGGVFVGDGKYRFLETDPSAIEEYVRAEIKKLSEEKIIITLLSQWNLKLNSAQFAKVKQAAEEQQ